MTGAALIIQIQLPHGSAGEDVQIDSAAAIQKPRFRQVQHPLQHRCIDLFDFRRTRPQRKRPGDIRRAFPILTTRVDQKQTLRRNRHLVLRISAVMHHRRVGLISADRAEAFLDKTFLLSAQRMQLSVNRTFAHRFFADTSFQPVH